MYTTLTALLTAIADAIRAKTGGSAVIPAQDIPTAIGGITTLEEGTADATANAADILSGRTAYAKGRKVAGAIINRGGVTAEIAAGESYNVPSGFHDGTGSVAAKPLASQTVADAAASDIDSGKTAWVNGAKVTGTVTTAASLTGTPGTADKTLGTNVHVTGAITVKGDANLAAGNIKSGVSIFGVAGSYTGRQVETADVTTTGGRTLTVPNLSGYTNFVLTAFRNVSDAYMSTTNSWPVNHISRIGGTVKAFSVYAYSGDAIRYHEFVPTISGGDITVPEGETFDYRMTYRVVMWN